MTYNTEHRLGINFRSSATQILGDPKEEKLVITVSQEVGRALDKHPWQSKILELEPRNPLRKLLKNMDDIAAGASAARRFYCEVSLKGIIDIAIFLAKNPQVDKDVIDAFVCLGRGAANAFDARFRSVNNMSKAVFPNDPSASPVKMLRGLLSQLSTLQTPSPQNQSSGNTPAPELETSPRG